MCGQPLANHTGQATTTSMGDGPKAVRPTSSRSRQAKKVRRHRKAAQSTTSDGSATTAPSQPDLQQVPDPQFKQPVVLEAQAGKADPVNESQEVRKEAAPEASTVADQVAPQITKQVHGGPLKATVTANTQVNKTVTREVSAVTTKRADTQDDHTANLEQRIKNLEDLVRVMRREIVPDELPGTKSNLHPHPQEAQNPQPNEAIVSDESVSKATTVDEPAQPEQCAVVQTKNSEGPARRPKKKSRPRRMVRKRAAPLAQVNPPASHAPQPQQAQNPQPNEAIVGKERITEAAVLHELPEYSEEANQGTDRTASTAALAEQMVLFDEPTEAILDPRAEVAKEPADDTVEFEEQVDESVLLHELPEHSHETDFGIDQSPQSLESAAGTVRGDEPAEPIPDPYAQAVTEQPEGIVHFGEHIDQTVRLHELPSQPQEAPLRADKAPGGAVSPTTTLVLDEPSAETPDSYATASAEIVGDFPAVEVEGFEGYVEPALDPDSGGEVIAEQAWGPQTGVGLGGHTGRPPCRENPARKTVLVIDDDAVMRMLLKMGLPTHGYDCLTADNGKAAQTLLQTHRPDLILVDLMMPVMDGLTFIRWLRQTARDATPVLVFSNVSTPKITQEALESGANSFACKPLHLNELLEIMSQLVPDESTGYPG